MTKNTHSPDSKASSRNKKTRTVYTTVALTLAICGCGAFYVQYSHSVDPTAEEAAQYLVKTGKLKGKVEDVTVGPDMAEFGMTSAARVGCDVFFTISRRSSNFDQWGTKPFVATGKWVINPISWKGRVGVGRDPQCTCGFTVDDTNMIVPDTFDEVDPALKKPENKLPESSPLLDYPCGAAPGYEPEEFKVLDPVPTGWAAVRARMAGDFD